MKIFRSVNFEYATALLMVTVTAITFLMAVLTKPLSGPFCVASCFQYPYTEAISRFPADYIWMYFAIIWLVLYLIFMVCLQRFASEATKIFANIGLLFAVMAALILITNYFVQLSVIQPSLINGEFDGIALLTQFNPHGIFIALEELGFMLMSTAFLFTAALFTENRMVRSLFIGNFMLMVIAFTVISLLYGIEREYRFEVAVITINWITLIVAGILLSTRFKSSR